MKQNLAALVKVKSIVTFAVLALFAYLVVSGREVPDAVNYLVNTVIVFYFGTQHEARRKEGVDGG